MNRRLRSLCLLLATVATLLTLTVGTAVAAEDTGAEESGKVAFPETARDRVGLVIFGVVGLAVLAGGINAVRQLKGDRPQADGKIRWR
jgi:hypothetical protein